MNAACALQHFCDIHGPQTLLCTEERPYMHDLNNADNDNLKEFYVQYIKSSDHSQNKVECKSCTLSSNGTIVSTADPLNYTLYISSTSTPNQTLFKNIRNACVRSLNIEKSTENDHPVFFGDDDDGYCLSLTFSCKDFHARGSQRLYSLCYLCSDKYHMISLMRLITDCMVQVVHWLQTDADQTYEHEARIKVNTNLGEARSTYVFRPPPRVPSQRTLGHIVHDSKITHRIHALFVWILRMSHSTINESLFDALPTEDQTTQEERRDAWKTDCIARSRTRTIMEIVPAISTNINSDYLRTALYSSMEDHNYNDNDDFDDDDFDSLEYQFSSYGYKALQLFKVFSHKLNNIKHLKFILYNWIIGNQLIIKYTNSTLDKESIRAIASVFRLFLPDGCCRLIETLDSIASYDANLVLIDTDLLEISNDIEITNDTNSIVIRIIIENFDDPIQVAKLEALPILKADIVLPTYVKTIVELLADNSLDEEAFEAIITQHKMMYLNKAKLYFQLGRCAMATTLLKSERQEMDILHIKNPSDLLMIRFWQKGLSYSYASQIRALKKDDNQQQRQQKK